MEVAVFALGVLVTTAYHRLTHDDTLHFPRTVVFALGSWAQLKSEKEGQPLEILEAKWGIHDITREMQAFVAGTDRIEFAVCDSLVGIITDHRFALTIIDSPTLFIKYT